jgi:hypothetical protein
LNGSLTQIDQKHKTVLLDLDIGQPVFGMPCCISIIEILKPILSNYEIQLPRGEGTNQDVIKLVKSFLINEIAPDSQEEYFVSTDYQKSKSNPNSLSIHGMVGRLFEELKDYYKEDKVVVIVNTNGWNSSVGSLIHKAIIDTINPTFMVEQKGIDYRDPNQLDDNLTVEAISVLEAYKTMKGKKRRNRLQEYELFDIHTSNSIYKEHVTYPDKLISYDFKENLSDILLQGKFDLYTMMKIQKVFEYDLSNIHLSADMAEYFQSDINIFEHLSDIFNNMIVAVCKAKRTDLSALNNQDDEDNQMLKYTFYK